MKNFVLGIISIVVAFTFLAAGGEIAIRIVHFYTGYISNEKTLQQLSWMMNLDGFLRHIIDMSGN